MRVMDRTTPSGSKSRPRRRKPGPLTAVVILLAAIALLFAFAPHLSTNLLWFLRANGWWFVTGSVLVVLAIVGFLSERPALIVVFLLGLVATVAFGFVHSYQVAKTYGATAAVSEEALPEFGQRAPYEVATSQARSQLGAVNGDLTSTRFLSGEDYVTAVRERGTFGVGYSTLLDQSIPLTGRGTAETCDFAEQANARMGGWFGSKLERIINSQQRNVTAHEGDVFGYCDDGVPVIVAPLVQQDGIFFVHEVPAGVALYRGDTGEVSFAESAPNGPSYPISVAAKQREGTQASGSWWEYMRGKVGYEQADSQPNSNNPSELTLATGDDLSYVSPLTGRGSTSSISSIGMVSTNGSVGYAPLVITALDPSWVSPYSIYKRIQSDYADIPNWQNLTVFEVAPLSDERWVATIGNEENVLYRVEGIGALVSGDPEATCLYRADGSQLRCGTLADSNGNGVGTQYGEDGETDIGSAPSDLSTLTNEQLAELDRRIGEENARRLADLG